jgi:hypothetical protein
MSDRSVQIGKCTRCGRTPRIVDIRSEHNEHGHLVDREATCLDRADCEQAQRDAERQPWQSLSCATSLRRVDEEEHD